MEIVQFLPSKKFSSIITMKDGLQYTGRIQTEEEISIIWGTSQSLNQTSLLHLCFMNPKHLSGPYSSFSLSHKRTTTKIWQTVVCCCTAISIKIMDNFSIDAFIMAFTRFACDQGYPKKLYCDGGS